MIAVLDLLQAHAQHARITERTLYTNMAGFASDVGDDLIDRVAAFAAKVEVSRHFHQAAGNQAIMRFRPGIAVADQVVFESVLRKLTTKLEVVLVCIAQAGGVQSAAQVLEYLTHPALATHLDLSCLTDGYYFWNLTGTYRDLDVTFELSDYATMLREHASGRIYQLVFHTNGNLCAGWNPAEQILWSAAAKAKRAAV